MPTSRPFSIPMRVATAADVRAMIALHLYGKEGPARPLGEIALHPHQREASVRVRRLLETHGGALLADDVGLGKTFVALDVARDAARPVVIAPAAIRQAWRDAAWRSGIELPFVSIESLSRRGPPGITPDLVIIDEAHHLRSADTRRHRAASILCANARVLMLSATPVQNSTRDLRAIMALFAGSRAAALSDEELAGYVVRRSAADVALENATLPALAAPMWLPAVNDVDCLERLLALPRAVPPRDGDDAGVLLSYTLMRQWASSRAALVAALQRRLSRAHAMEDALLAGRMPTRAELSAWSFAEGIQQLVFPELAITSTIDQGAALLDQVRLHASAVRDLLEWIGMSADPDVLRAATLRAVMQRHHGERIIAFSEYADTIAALYRALVPDTRVAMLTHAGGRVAGGMISRREVLARFAPGASQRTRDSERIDVLLTTDVLSEGVNLQDASVVVHIDLSWNPARLQQRVGRVRRLGAARDRVSVYLVPPPAPAEHMLRLERRLRLKIGEAARTVGLAGAILPGIRMDSGDASAVREQRIAGIIRTWHDGRCEHSAERLIAGACVSTFRAALACIRCGDDTALVAMLDGRVTDARDAVEQVVLASRGDSRVPPADTLNATRESIERWLRHRFVASVVHLPALRAARARRAVLRRVDSISRRAPRQSQSRLAPLMHAARAAATATLSSGAERVLDELARCSMEDEAWLQAVGEFATLHARGDSTEAPRLLAILLLLPEDGL